MAKLHSLRETSTFLIICLIGVCKVVCFLPPGSQPDSSYLAFTFDATNFTPAPEYDYIIVGGGTAGCPLAATLSENYSVLLLERGVVASSDPNILFEANSLVNIINSNERNSIAQSYTSEDGIPNNRGNLLGGSSMINFGFYSRADKYFYNVSGIQWDMSKVTEAYEWVEDSVVSIPDQLNTWQNSTYNALLESGVLPANGFTVEHIQDLSYLAFTYDAANFTPAPEYDYIIVGGGTAGCPLAATLSENYSVLLLERGGVASLDPNVLFENNSLANIINANEQDSIAQSFTSEDGIPNNRGNVLGGSSMVNFGFYSRADNYFYNVSGIQWDMENVTKAYEWVEDSIVSIPELNTWQNSTYNALLESGVLPENGFTVEHLQGTKISGSTFDRSGIRHGAVELLNRADRRNLDVVVLARVNRIMFSRSRSSGVFATGVVYDDYNGRRHRVRIRTNGEVIISAGAISSPQLLQLSGVGPASYLKSLGIAVVHDQPNVGQFMADKPRLGIALLVPFPLADVGGKVIGIYSNSITTPGPYIESLSGVTPFDSPANPIVFPFPYPPLNLSVLSIVSEVTRPSSFGSLSLKSANDARVTPKVRFNYYSKPEDLKQCAEGVNAIDKMLRTQAMDKYKFTDRDGSKYFQFVGVPLPRNLSNEDSVNTFCRQTLRTFWHFTGGCLVNKVVDSELKVMGINALRIVDSSVFSDSPGTNPQATVMMLGRYMGVKIRSARG